jgi:acyl-CoA reductase-like NAD-dependent aldehyde dehydrogenase
MRDEIFGCVLPVLPYSNLSEVIKLINSKDKALTVYYFGNPDCSPNSALSSLKRQTSSGHFVVNDVLMQHVTAYVGFGGVGASGSGRIGGYEGFKNFSNRKGVLITGARKPQLVMDLT